MAKIIIREDGCCETDDLETALALSRRFVLSLPEKYALDCQRMRAAFQEILATGVDPMRVQLVESAESGGKRTWYFEVRREERAPELFDSWARERVVLALERWLKTQPFAQMAEPRKSLAVDFALHCLQLRSAEGPRIWFGDEQISGPPDVHELPAEPPPALPLAPPPFAIESAYGVAPKMKHFPSAPPDAEEIAF